MSTTVSQETLRKTLALVAAASDGITAEHVAAAIDRSLPHARLSLFLLGQQKMIASVRVKTAPQWFTPERARVVLAGLKAAKRQRRLDAAKLLRVQAAAKAMTLTDEQIEAGWRVTVPALGMPLPATRAPRSVFEWRPA